jgi:hypothetical protein
MEDWDLIFKNLSDSEKDKIAVLRVMECANGVVQYAFRDNAPYALSLEETRKAMKFSMSCMKNMSIPLKDGTITFESETEKILRKARDLYISGFKKGNSEDLDEFYKMSASTVVALGEERLVTAKELLEKNIDDIPPHALMWGVDYLKKFLP